MLKKAFYSTLLLLSITLFLGCSSDNSADAAADLISSKEFVLTTLSNSQIVIKEGEEGFYIEGQKDKLVIFDIFATWCPPCQASASHLSSLQEKYKDQITIIGITIEKTQTDEKGVINNDKLKQFKIKNDARYTIVNSNQNARVNAAIVKMLKMGERYPIPLMAIYKDGKYINHYVGLVQEEFVESDIKRALEI